LLSSASRLDAASVLPLSTVCTALKNSELTWLYFSPVTRDGRATALVKVSYSSPKNGVAFKISWSWYRAAMVGLKDPLIARRFCSSAEVRCLTRSTASSAFSEYFETASCQPPSAPVCLPSSPPLGSWLTPILPAIGLSGALPSAQA
jgi:hypothetical protein